MQPTTTPAIDSFMNSVVGMSFWLFGIAFLGIAFIFRWELQEFLEVYVIPAAIRCSRFTSAWATRHERLLRVFDWTVVAPAVILGLGWSTVTHRWVWIAFWGLQACAFWKRRERRQQRSI